MKSVYCRIIAHALTSSLRPGGGGGGDSHLVVVEHIDVSEI